MKFWRSMAFRVGGNITPKAIDEIVRFVTPVNQQMGTTTCYQARLITSTSSRKRDMEYRAWIDAHRE